MRRLFGRRRLRLRICVGGASCKPITCAQLLRHHRRRLRPQARLRRVRRRPGLQRRHLHRPGLRAADLHRRRQRPLLRHHRRRLRRHARLRRVPDGGTCGGRRRPERLRRPDLPNDHRARRWAASTAAPSATAAAACSTAATCANGMACRHRRPGARLPGLAGRRVPPTCIGRDQDDDHRHRLRPRRREPALQRHRLRAERAARRDPDGRPLRSLRRPGRASRSRRRSPTRRDVPLTPSVPSATNIPLVIQVGKWRRQITIPSSTTCADNALTDTEPDAAAAHAGRGQHPAHRRDHGRLRRARVPAPPHRHRRLRVHDRRRRRPRPPLRRRRRNEQLHGGRHLRAATTLWSNRDASSRATTSTLLSCEGSTSSSRP